MLNLLAKMGQWFINVIAMIGRSGMMLFGALIGQPQFKKQFPLLVKQFYFVGVQSRSEERRVGKECRYRWSRYL